MKSLFKATVVAALFASASLTQVASAATAPVVSVPVPASTGKLATTTVALNQVSDEAGGFFSTFGTGWGGKQNGVSTLNKLFTNDYTFTVDGLGQTAGAVSASFTATQDVVIKSFDLYTSAGVLVLTGLSDAASTKTQEQDSWYLPEMSFLTAGNYYLQVTGQVLGAAGGVYGGSMSVTAVPEPETYAMMLAGLGLVGFIGRRKAAKKAA